MLSDFLGAENVVCCCSGEEALDACQRQRFDFVILDICMKNSTSGLDTFQHLREAAPGAGIILCTGNLAESIPATVLENCHAHLLKPFKLDDLSTILNMAVEV